jgi:hypothetical protein
MTLTPRQVAAYLKFGARLDRLDLQADLVITATGAQGDQKALEKLVKELDG